MDDQQSDQPQVMPIKAKILIVEDERPIANALEFKFNLSGYQAKAVYDGEQALSELQQTKYDFVLLDLIMPRLDGHGLLTKLKELNIQIPPFIIVSNLSQKSDIATAKQLGAKDYIIKANYGVNDIINIVSSLIDNEKQSVTTESLPQPQEH